MRQFARRLARETELSGAEADYLRDVAQASVGTPRRPRRMFLRDTAELLSGRPPALSRSVLVEALGSPPGFVGEWRREEGFGRWSPPWVHWWHQSRLAQLGQVAAIATAVALGFSTHNHYTAEPEIRNSCSGASAQVIEHLAAAGETEYRMSLVLGARYGVALCPWSADEGVVIERVYLPSPVQLAIQPVGWELSLPAESSGPTGDASAHHEWDASSARWANVVVWFEAEYCNISGGISFDHLSVDYRYRGRSRTTDVDLLATYSVWSEVDQCSETVRAESDALDEAWSSVVDQRLIKSSWPEWFGGVGEFDLWPVSVSRDLCRYLRGVLPPRLDDGSEWRADIEPLEARAVFQLEAALATTLIDGAVLGICPEFAHRRDELVAVLADT